MNKIEIMSLNRNYIVSFDSQISDNFEPEDFYIIDIRFKEKFVQNYEKTFWLEASEENKTIETCLKIFQWLNSLSCKKESILHVIGGGMVQDIGSFVASLYMRGLVWKYYPSTLMSMVDSCIGGKSSINYENKKNILGNFYPPSQIKINTFFLETISEVEIVSGLCEAIKIAFARDIDVFLNMKNEIELNITSNYKDYKNIINLSLISKKWFIEIDEFDKNERKLLNFGHTFGHAIESASKFTIGHGIAVGIGMLIAIKFSKLMGNEIPNELNQIILKILDSVKDIFVVNLSAIDINDYLTYFMSDKKHNSDQYRVVIPICSTLEIINIDKNIENNLMIIKSFNDVREDLGK